MTPARYAPTQRRRDDSTWFRILDRFGLPTLLTLLLFWAWQGAIREERASQAGERDRLIGVMERQTRALDANTAAALAQVSELRTIADRVRQLEETGARAMARVGPPHR